MWTRTGRVENKAQTMKHQDTCIAGGSWDSGTSISAVNLDLRKNQHRKGLSMYQQRSTCPSVQEPVTPDIPKQKYWQSQCYEPKMSRYVMYPVVQNPFTPQEWIWSSLSQHSESLMIALRSNFLLTYHKPPHTPHILYVIVSRKNCPALLALPPLTEPPLLVKYLNVV